MSNKTYGVDVASYQDTDMAAYRKAGASFAIVKLTEGTDYVNPKAQAQVTSSRANHLFTHAYHFARFGSSVSQAKKEAAYFIKQAKKEDISQKRMLWLDWEAGSGNVVTGAKASNTAAIMAFMDAVKAAGWRPGLYSGASLMRSAIDTAQIVKRYGTCLWVASYPTMAAVSSADFGYFPSMDGVAIWQFTSNWHGLNVDGNVAVAEINATSATPAPKPKPKPTATDFKGVVKVKNLGAGKASWKVRLLSKDGHYTDSYVPQNSRWKTSKMATIKGKKCYLIGKDLWIPAEFVTVQ
ncbi:lysin [Lactobacillus delbrueckii subsp. bulgaricus]|uniref:endolysin n=1 Tax=Lactobacillus phage phiJB TaxID=1399941 RepID=UPI0003B0AF90|nr:GH25 family lysozyme [Lactobacillus delbrueckii]YP_008772020.1 endolysin [Lactobacillus phage phiJB]AGW43638.1 muramidase [Lactobacillus phage phiJB]AYC66177.1 lysin [Lactobacillus delbrueckii subsp. bulgaricus]MBT9088013.1 lysin [Lactobacillus delbrueckii subsp. bulgaricus]MBT9089654.1 lysin [Lactobacillus delbrueckii subsp. bulgaricus]MBT9091289.1 lysin [Lactobacillus delbrueckii subsp. bulgaricus]